jgi:hypothetical protein
MVTKCVLRFWLLPKIVTHVFMYSVRVPSTGYVRWHLYILPGNIRYPAEWTGVNVPVVFRMKIKISKPAFHFLFQELFALIYWRIKYFKLKYGLSLYGVYIGIWLFVLYHKQKYLLFIKVHLYNNQNFISTITLTLYIHNPVL